jgi:hypothetical protein
MSQPSGYGGSSYGSDPYGGAGGGGGGGTFVLQAAVATAENVVRLFFSALPSWTGLLDPHDASSASHYSVAPVSGSTGGDGLPAAQATPIFATVGEDPNSIDVFLDRPMSPYPAEYSISVTGLVQAGTLTTLSPDPSTTLFFGVYRALAPPSTTAAAPSADFANPVTVGTLGAGAPVVPVSLAAAQTLLGTYVAGSNGDYASDQGLASYKKRVLRRGLTIPGAFAHLPTTYGVGIPAYGKKLASPSLRGRLAAEWQAQIYQEPETLSATVTAVMDPANPGLCYFVVDASMRGGAGSVRGRLPFPVA